MLIDLTIYSLFVLGVPSETSLSFQQYSNKLEELGCVNGIFCSLQKYCKLEAQQHSHKTDNLYIIANANANPNPDASVSLVFHIE